MSYSLLRALTHAYVFTIGLVVGSFLNVVIYRVPRGISVAKGRSFCESCGTQLKAADLVPVFSWLFLRGRCRYCKARIPFRYTLVELMTGAFAVVCCLVFDFKPVSLLAFSFVSVIICLSFIDIDTMELPPALMWILAGLSALSVFVTDEPLLSRAVGFFAVSAPLLLITLLVPGSFGGGDIKLVAICGFLLGWKKTLLAAFIAIILGGAFGIYLLATKKKGRKDVFAFGPFLAAGAVTALLFGDRLIAFYLGLFGYTY